MPAIRAGNRGWISMSQYTEHGVKGLGREFRASELLRRHLDRPGLAVRHAFTRIDGSNAT
jgi:hypothetical protein